MLFETRSDELMPQTNKNPYVSATLAEILTACTLARNALDEQQAPDLADDLMTIYVAVDDLLEFALPTPSEGQLHGLPKKATTTHFSTVQFAHENNPAWDYRAWFAGKIMAAKDHIRRAITAWRDFQAHPNPRLRDELSRQVGSCQTYANVVYEEVINERLEIKELSSE